MATGQIRSQLEHTKTLKVAHTAAVAIGDIVVNNGQVLIAINAALISADNIFAYDCRKVEMPKAGGLAINPGDVVYWDATNSVINKTSSGNTKAGMCVEAAASADATVIINLKPNI